MIIGTISQWEHHCYTTLIRSPTSPQKMERLFFFAPFTYTYHPGVPRVIVPFVSMISRSGWIKHHQNRFIFFLGIVTVAPITLSYAIRKWLFPSVFHLSLGNYPMISQHLPIPNAIRALHSSFWASRISARRPANKRQGLETAEEMFVLRVYLTIVRMSY